MVKGALRPEIAALIAAKEEPAAKKPKAATPAKPKAATPKAAAVAAEAAPAVAASG